MDLGFRGEIADLYRRYRRGYPPPVITTLIDALAVQETDVVVDLGCGTGQLAIPMARHVRAVLGIDPEGDMLEQARRAAADDGVVNSCWLLGADTDVPALSAALGPGSVAAITIGQALHWMDHATLFRAAAPLLRPGGGIAVVTNGIPLWLQDSAWSRALREVLQEWFAMSLRQTCGTDTAAQEKYAESMSNAGFAVSGTTVEYTEELTTEQLIGSVYSALSIEQLPPPELRPLFAERLAGALEPHAPFVEQVPVKLLVGRKGD